mmetsp:Transcript_10653/g.20647  ORF Transcript_10653/g.20647 Transcript_10653/m.20647 type:complete len:94 (-) Transcript_10653:633-914(-)
MLVIKREQVLCGWQGRGDGKERDKTGERTVCKDFDSPSWSFSFFALSMRLLSFLLTRKNDSRWAEAAAERQQEDDEGKKKPFFQPELMEFGLS